MVPLNIFKYKYIVKTLKMQIIKSGIVVAIFTLISRVFGYIRDIFMASYLGLNADTFAVAFRIPNTFRTLFAEGAFSSAFVPMFSSKLATENQQNALKFASQVFSLLTVILVIFTTLMMIFMPQIVSILAPGFAKTPDKLLITITLSYFTMPYLFFIALSSLYAGVLNSSGKFAAAAALPVILSTTMILSIKYLTPFAKSPSHALSYGVLIAGIVQFLSIIYAAHRASLEIKFTKIIITDDMKLMFKKMVPTVIGSGALQINLAISTVISSYIDGAASILYYAERLNQFPLAIIGTALGTVLLPTLSKQVRENNLKSANSTQNKALEVALFLTLPCAFALAMISDTLITFLFERGNFTPEDSYKVSRTLSALALGLPAFVMIKIFTPRYFAQYDTSTPVRISFMCIALNIILALSLVPFLSYLGIAIATSTSAWINVTLLYYFQRKRNMFLIDKKLAFQTIKIISSCTLMIFTLILFEHFILNSASNNYLLLLFIGEIILGMLVYFVSSYYFKTLDLSFLLKVKKTNG